MKRPVSEIAFTPSVKLAQEQRGSRANYQRMEQRGGWQHKVTPELATFIGERDSIYLGTASADGQPYIQHRGGPKGFLKVIDEKTLAFADFVGNAQYISVGNLNENNKAFIFLSVIAGLFNKPPQGPTRARAAVVGPPVGLPKGPPRARWRHHR